MKLSPCVILYKIIKKALEMQMTKQRKTEKNQFCHKIKSHDATQGRIQGGVLGVKTPTLFGKFFQFARVF